MNAQTPPNALMTAALAYAARGWLVFPVGAGTKGRDAQGNSTHLLAKGHLGASKDVEVVRAWWTRWPDANIGLNLAASGLVALDPDTYKADCEWDAFIADKVIPETLVQLSPRGGRHYIFTANPESRFAGQLCADVDIKHRGYILLEPSVFEGRAYRFETNFAPAPVPDWVPRQGQRRDNLPTPPTFATPGMDKTSLAEVEDLLSFIDPDAEGYAAWIEVLQALHDHFDGGSEGLHLADQWSSRGAMYRSGEVAAKWKGFRAGGGVTLATLAQRARQNGADLSEIARRHKGPQGGGAARCDGPQTGHHESNPDPDDLPDLSHDHLALDLGRRSWDWDARYVAQWDQWLFWTGTHWRRDDTLMHMSQVRAYLRRRAAELTAWAERKAATLQQAGDEKGAGKLRSRAKEQARTLRSNATVAAVSGLARGNKETATTHDAFDGDHMLLGTPGGTVELRSGLLRSACREDMISRMTTCAPADPGVTPTLWVKFLNEVFAGDKEIMDFLQRAAGYALTGATEEHKLLFFHGSGRNGKSVFLNTLLHLLGDYGRRVSATTFLHSQTERHPTDIAGLQGARLAIASELPRGKTWDEAVIKDLTGGDRMTARYMRQDFFDFDPQLTLMIAGNTQPSFRGVDEAIRSRVVLVPFSVTIPPEHRDRALPDKLRREGPAILRWCIDGALAWQARGLDVPRSLAAASEAYFDEEDTIGQFLADETQADPHAFTASEDLILRFNQWAERQGLGQWAQRTLVKELRQRGFANAKSNGRRGLRGLSFR